MLTNLTGTIEFWMAFSTVCMILGAYKLLTKQNSEQIKELSQKSSEQINSLGEKFESIRLDIKMDQVKMQGNFEHMNEKINRIENDTAITRAKSNELSESIAEIRVKLKSIENGGYRNGTS